MAKTQLLIACEESQTVTKEFRKLGVEAFSCDIEECSGGKPEWHIQRDVTEVLKEEWLAIVAFPPCTHLAVSGAAWFKQKQADGRQQQGIDFFMLFANCNAEFVAIENPIGIMSTQYRKPDQIIQPYQFGDPYTKATCLWLKNLPLLVPTEIVSKGERVTFSSGKSMPKWYSDARGSKDRSKIRSKTFQGIATAMAEQWSKVIKEKQ